MMMDVIQAVQERRSVRWFNPDPLPTEQLRQIVEAGQWAPSWSNTQPWEFCVAGGAVLERVREEYSTCFLAGEPSRPEIPPAGQWPEPYRSRTVRDGKDLFNLMQITRGDEAARREFRHKNYLFFGAPVCIFLHTARSLGEWSMFDLGLASENMMLAAKSFGMDSIAAVSLVAYPDILRRHLSIPAEHKLVIGIALGYPDQTAVVNRHRSRREPLDEVCRFYGV